MQHQSNDSALRRSMLTHVDYGYTDVLLTNVLDVLQIMSWQLAGDENAPRPDRVLLPGQVPVTDGHTADSMSIDEMDARLEKYGPRR